MEIQCCIQIFKKFIIVESVPVQFDAWIVGDKFLETNELHQLLQFRGAANQAPLYLQEFFNVKIFHKQSNDSKLALSRVINALTEAVNEKDARLPKYLIVTLDQDIIRDLTDIHNFEAHKVLSAIIDWVVWQLNMIVRRKRVDLWEKKPGSLSCVETNVIFVKMLCRIGSFHQGSTMQGVCSLHPKFNDALNDAVAKIEPRVMTINSCNTYGHFDKKGDLSQRGRIDFWY